VREILRTVAQFHGQGVVMRDIKARRWASAAGCASPGSASADQ